MKRTLLVVAVTAMVLLPLLPPSAAALVQVTASVETTPVRGTGDAADDPAIWIDPSDPGRSVVIGTDKSGGLAVYDLSGTELQYDATVKPNNVDLRYGFPLGGGTVDLVAFSNKRGAAIGAYAVDPSTRTVVNVAAGTIKPTVSPEGFCLYHSPATGKFYAFVVASNGTVEQWELFDNGAGKVAGSLVRSFVVGPPADDGGAVAEGCVADDTYGAFYVSEERVAIWRYGAEPGDGEARTRVEAATAGHLKPDIEGLTIYQTSGAGGYLIASSQGSNQYAVYDRAGNGYIGNFAIADGVVDGVSHTDGLDVTNVPLGPGFPEGLLVVQDDKNPGANQNFKLVPWGSVARAFSPALAIDTTFDPRTGATSVGNRPPSVNAGADQHVAFGDQASLAGSAFDDGLPDPPHALSVLWSQDSGPGTTTFGDATSLGTTATFSDAGVYILRLTANDGEKSASDTVMIQASDASTVKTVEIRVGAKSDDAEEVSSGKVTLSSSGLDLVLDGTNQTVGMRFAGVSVPHGATIVRAYVTFTAHKKGSAATALTIQGQAVPDAPTFTKTNLNVSGRARTLANVAWSPPPWPTVGAAGVDQRTSDLASIVQEIVDRTGWASGHALVLIVTGSGKRVAEAYDSKPAAAPLLHIEYR